MLQAHPPPGPGPFVSLAGPGPGWMPKNAKSMPSPAFPNANRHGLPSETRKPTCNHLHSTRPKPRRGREPDERPVRDGPTVLSSHPFPCLFPTVRCPLHLPSRPLRSLVPFLAGEHCRMHTTVFTLMVSGPAPPRRVTGSCSRSTDPGRLSRLWRGRASLAQVPGGVGFGRVRTSCGKRGINLRRSNLASSDSRAALIRAEL